MRSDAGDEALKVWALSNKISMSGGKRLDYIPFLRLFD